MKKLAVIPVVAILALAGCSTTTEAAPTTTPTVSTVAPAAEKPIPGKGNISSDGVDFTTLTKDDLKLTTDKEYAFVSSKGAEGKVTFVDATDPDAAKIEKYLQKAIGYHREYLKVRVDNTQGSEVVSIPEVTVEGSDELEYPFVSMNSTISDAIPVMNDDYSYTTADGLKELTEAEYDKIRDEGYALEEKQRVNIKPGGQGTLLFAIEIDKGAMPKDIATIAVPVHGMFEEVMARNPLLSEYVEWKAFQEAGKEWEAQKSATPTS